jgi:hypothetical protein
MDGSGNVAYLGNFCLETGFTIEASTTGGVGYSAVSGAFSAELKVIDCTTHLAVAAPLSPFYEFVVDLGSLTGTNIIASLGMTTTDATNCPITGF